VCVSLHNGNIHTHNSSKICNCHLKAYILHDFRLTSFIIFDNVDAFKVPRSPTVVNKHLAYNSVIVLFIKNVSSLHHFYAWTVYATTLYPSICHKPVFYQNGKTYNHTSNTAQQPRDSSFLMPNVSSEIPIRSQ